MSRRCPVCSAEWSDKLAFCPNDGTRLGPPPNEDIKPEEWDDMFAKPRARERIRTPEVGEQLGPYRLEKLLGIGGMGAVFSAVHVRLERKVAIKVLNPELIHMPDVVARFFREAQAVNRIRHQNIVDITDFIEGSAEYPPYLVMDLLEGQSLGSYIKEKAPVPAQTMAAMTMQICSAMDAVHEVGIVHRDLKPDNIFLIQGRNNLPRIKLLDFGIAKFMAADAAMVTRPGELVGTPEYMAPEQVRGTKVDHRIDIYALGCIMYEMLTGMQPFSSTDLADLLRKQLHFDPQPPSAILADNPDAPPLPNAIEQVVMRCIEKDPEIRVQTMSDLRLMLKRSLEGETTMVKAMLASTGKKRRWIWGTAGAVCVCLLGLGIWWMLPSRKASSHEASSRPHAVEKKLPEPTNDELRVIKVSSKPESASVYRLSDGRFMGKTPVELKVSEKEQQDYLIRLTGYMDRAVTLKASSPSLVNVILGQRLLVDKNPRPARTTSRSRRREGQRGRHSSRTEQRSVRRRGGDTRIVDPFK